MTEHAHTPAPPSHTLTLTVDGADVIVATSQLKLIDSADNKPQRWVQNLTAITVKSAE